MTDTTDQKLVDEILGDEFTKQIITELGLENDTPEAQAELITMIGENLMSRLVLEIVKVLPESEHDAFEKFIGSGKLVELRDFLLPHIPDLDRFIQREITKEYEATKTRIHMIAEGVEDE